MVDIGDPIVECVECSFWDVCYSVFYPVNFFILCCKYQVD